MKQLPEAFMIYRAELKRVELEKEKLRREYERAVDGLNQELSFLREQIQSQQEMLKMSLDFAAKLQTEMGGLKEKIAKGQMHLRSSMH